MIKLQVWLQQYLRITNPLYEISIEKDTRLQIDKILKDYQVYNQELIDKRIELLHNNIVNLFS